MDDGHGFDPLLAAAQAGAAWAFERLYRELSPAVAGYLRVQGANEPEDLTSDVFFKVFSSMAGFTGDASQFRSWVFTIAHHRLVDERRRQSRHPAPTTLDAAGEPAGGDAEDDALRRLGAERAREMCRTLPPEQRDVLLLRMMAGMSLQETAEALGKSVGAIKALQHRAVATLRKNLQREGVSR